jgi:molybdopterin-guanine dinucleotide biosynthesis protein A
MRMENDQGSAVDGFVLAGGRSSRMGREKALLEIGGEPLVLRAARLLDSVCGKTAIIGPPERYGGFGFPAVADDHPGLGPLGGIATALSRAAASWNLILACDLPYLSGEWLRFLIQRARVSHALVVLPESAAGPEPLCAAYHREGATAIRAAIARGERKVTRALDDLPVERILPGEIREFDPRGVLFQNLNAPEEYARAREDLEAGQPSPTGRPHGPL